MQEKLALAAQEAEDAAAVKMVTDEREAAETRQNASAAENAASFPDEQNENINMHARRSPARRRSGVKGGGRAKRRKSTLSPEELEALMGLAD